MIYSHDVYKFIVETSGSFLFSSILHEHLGEPHIPVFLQLDGSLTSLANEHGVEVIRGISGQEV